MRRDAFERALAKAGSDALALYRGELLPGHYDDWIDEERLRLAALAERAEAALRPRRRRADAAARSRRLQPAGGGRRERSPLPIYLTRFFGREADAARLREALVAHRLVTLLGPGGAGKTRLATEVAAAWRAGRRAAS